jgi:hypothetical protein
MAYKPINIREILRSKINGPQEDIPGQCDILQNLQVVPKPEMPISHVVPTLKIHLDITSQDNRGNRVDIEADIYNQEDLQKFNALYEKHMPKKGFLGLW